MRNEWGSLGRWGRTAAGDRTLQACLLEKAQSLLILLTAADPSQESEAFGGRGASMSEAEILFSRREQAPNGDETPFPCPSFGDRSGQAT